MLVLQDMNESCQTMVRCAVGVTEQFKLEVGLHQGSVMSPFSFPVMMDRLTGDRNLHGFERLEKSVRFDV